LVEMMIRIRIQEDVSGKTVKQILERLTVYLTSLKYIEGKAVEHVEITPTTLIIDYIEDFI